MNKILLLLQINNLMLQNNYAKLEELSQLLSRNIFNVNNYDVSQVFKTVSYHTL